VAKLGGFFLRGSTVFNPEGKKQTKSTKKQRGGKYRVGKLHMSKKKRGFWNSSSGFRDFCEKSFGPTWETGRSKGGRGGFKK